jgi:hypothetical protein
MGVQGSDDSIPGENILQNILRDKWGYVDADTCGLPLAIVAAVPTVVRTSAFCTSSTLLS